MVETINENIEGKNAVVICKTQNLDKYNCKYKLDMGNNFEEISKNVLENSFSSKCKREFCP